MTLNANLNQSMMENSLAEMAVRAANFQAAEIRATDVDAAAEMAEFAGKSALAHRPALMPVQARLRPQLALSLMM
jgi:flagellin-like hook-associated protein FlgL